ncbi:thiamine-phosphate kinase [Methanothermobacter thermautotrophicus]|uniref:Thiamine-monophosphate kinase n=1 Tax=Methanothermobacter thermautotrophicus TaxID=145262 RepID=A0A842YQS3_METTF|nr:thiamine-phosphate kinase [Methanothermobacter thermautotrophicus]MBE2900025.1 thiamine-phosphate kinase [Methanothermobacter thermautotrophicus]
MHDRISSLGEKKLISRIISRSRSVFGSSKLMGLGDDAALIDAGDDYLVLTSDLLLETRHFPDPGRPRDMGWKTVTVNMSDLAAMGSRPEGFILSAALPDLELEFFDSIMDGVIEACCHYQAPLMGGDTNEADEIILSGTAIGRAAKDRVLMKSGARPGDLVAVTGPLGVGAAGTELILSGKSTEGFEDAVERSLRPVARIEDGIILAESGLVSSATDITDGLVSELGELMDASGTGMRIYEESLPIGEEVPEIAAILGMDPLELALYYGEDFELVFTAHPAGIEELSTMMDIHVIGEVTGGGSIEMVDKDGATYKLQVRGYEHLSPA